MEEIKVRNQCAPLVVSGVVFTVVALMHVLRIFYHWSVVIDGVIVPESVSTIAIILAGILAIWMFCTSVCRR
ncbi:MAG: hypothetical protein A3E82_05335 [Gammaproteobacteria bacterium RIFCSPHIGHO2_12_FULL_38_11]|nr:MAG: hypothetical protein A3E82_05335 [Gammaproteobacteria bacterium RIFCSPHIGHO2_12_FULL_38_11]